MKIVVINASPKGKYSITLQSIRYIQKHCSRVEFEVFHVGQRIKAIERDWELCNSIVEAVETSDCVLWCYPVYTFLVPYQLVKFISLIFERKKEAVFKGKYASQISTSKHFFDHTAYNYIHNICEDLGMKHLHGHCADMDDLTTEQGRQRLLSFAEELTSSIDDSVVVSRKYAPVKRGTQRYTPSHSQQETEKPRDYDIVLVTDCSDRDSNLGRMIETFRKALPNDLKIVNIGDFDFQGGCLGCMQIDRY